jgi:hypothetical protein
LMEKWIAEGWRRRRTIAVARGRRPAQAARLHGLALRPPRALAAPQAREDCQGDGEGRAR